MWPVTCRPISAYVQKQSITVVFVRRWCRSTPIFLQKVLRPTLRKQSVLSSSVLQRNLYFWNLFSQNINGTVDLCRLMEFPEGDEESKTTHCVVRFEGFAAVTMKNVSFLGYKTPVRTSQETHYVSATEPSQLMQCKIWGFHGSDYEECRLLGYKNPICTSQETRYITTESSLLMLCKIWGFHGGDYEECLLLGI
jgi:hypothetical protein